MEINYLNQVVLGNSIKSYLLFLGIILFGLILKKLFSKIISKFFFTLFKRFSKEIKIDTFLELLVKPIELLITIIILYIAINQLSYPLDVVVFKRATSQPAYTVTVIEVLDKVFLFLAILVLKQAIRSFN